MEKLNKTASQEQEYIHHDFIVQGVKVLALFPKDAGENIMPLVKNILIDSYVSNVCFKCIDKKARM